MVTGGNESGLIRSRASSAKVCAGSGTEGQTNAPTCHGDNRVSTSRRELVNKVLNSRVRTGAIERLLAVWSVRRGDRGCAPSLLQLPIIRTSCYGLAISSP